MQAGLTNVQYTRETGLIYLSKAQGKNIMGLLKILLQESSVKGVGVCGVHHSTFQVSEDLILLGPACWTDL